MKRAAAVLLFTGITLPVFAGMVNWPVALRGVTAGDAQWLNQTPALATVANASEAQLLEDAMAAALGTNPSVTLAALRTIDAGKWPHMLGSEIVCTPPAEKTWTEIDAFYHRTRMALLTTRDGANCLWILEAAYAELVAERNRAHSKSFGN